MKVLFLFNLILCLILFLMMILIRLKFEGKYPRVTYIIAVSNGENYIECILRSLIKLQHRVSGLEIIVIDLKSSDQTPQILNRLAEAYNFKYYQKDSFETFPFEAGLIHADSRIIIYNQWDHSPIKNGTSG